MAIFYFLGALVAIAEVWAVTTWDKPRRRAHSIIHRPARPLPEMFQKRWDVLGDSTAPSRSTSSVLPSFKVDVPMPKGTKPPRPPCTCSKR